MTTSISFRSRSYAPWLAAVVAALALCGAQHAEAQEKVPGVIVDLGAADGPPGRTVSIPVNIALPEGTKVTELELVVRFQKDLLSFTRAALAPQGKADNLELTTAVEDDPKDPKQSVLRLKATGSNPLGSGAVVDLFIRINPKAKPPTGSTGHKAAKFTATLTRIARVGLGDGKLVEAAGRNGEIDITEGVALFGCFFYMH